MSKISDNEIAYAIHQLSRGASKTELSNILKKVVQFLCRKRLFPRIPRILEKLEKTINEENNLLAVKIISAKKMGNEDKKSIVKFLKERYKVNDVNITEIFDVKLLGGMRILVNDEIIDLSLQNKIKKLQEHLIRTI